MKKIMIVGILMGLVAGTWMPMIQAAPKDDLAQAANIANVVQGFANGICPKDGSGKSKCPNDMLNKVKMVIDLGATSIMTAATLSQTADTFQTKTVTAITDLQSKAKVVQLASDEVKVAVTTEEQIDALMKYLNAQGEFIKVIADYMAVLNSDIFNPVFSLIEAMPFVGDKVVISGKPASVVVGGMLTALQKRNDTYLKAVGVLPTVMKAVETKGAAASEAAPVVKGADFGF